MKTRNFLVTLGATALAAITINLNAADALLSPRAAANQIKHVSGTNNDVNLVNTTGVAISPRALASQVKTVTGTNNELNPAALCSHYMTGSPKAIQACAANPLAPMPCCAVAATK